MNRYVIDGVLADMRAGRRVVIFSESQAASRNAFQQVAAQLGPDETARRAYGREECVGAGRIHFRSVRGSGGRGMSADTVFVDTDLTPDQFADIIPIVMASPSAEAMRR